jgi:putative ABC transport system permease protein
MVMVLNKRIWRIFKENKGRYIGILILIFLGSFFFVVMSGLASNLGNMVSGFAEKHLQEDVSFSTGIPITDIAALEGKSGSVIDSYRFYDVTLSGGQPLQLISPSTKVNIPAITNGRGLENSGDILLEPNFLSLHDLAIGEQIVINGRAFTVTGTVALPHYVYALRFVHDVLPPSGFGIGLISDTDFTMFPEAAEVYSVRFANRENITAQTMGFNRLLREEGHTITGWIDAMNNKRIQMPWATITGAEAMSVPFSAIMFLICCLIVGVMILRMVKADGVIIGMLYAQGYRRKELIRHYLTLPLLLAVIGGVSGVLLAFPTVEPTVKMMIAYYNVPFTAIHLSPVTIVIGILMPVVFLVFAGFFVIRKELKKTAGELMKGDSGKTKINVLERTFKLERFKFNTKFQLREQMRSIPRLLFLLLGVSAASFLMLLGLTLNNSMNTVFGGTDDMFNFAVEYSFKAVQQGDVPEGAEAFNAIRSFPEGRENIEFYVMAITTNSVAVNLRDASGGKLSMGQVNITAPLATRLKLRAGDTINFIDRMNGESYSLVINGIAETYTGQFIFMPLDRFNEMTGMAHGSYSGLLSDRELDIDPNLLAGVKNLQEASDAMDDLAGPMMSMIIAVTMIAGLIGMVIIFLVTSLMIEESRGTISMLKVFGYRGKEIGKLILNSSTWVVIAGFVFGIPVTLIFGTAMWRYLGEMINMVLPMIINPMYVLISFVVIFAVYLFTKWLCGKKLAKISMSEALKAGAE